MGKGRKKFHLLHATSTENTSERPAEWATKLTGKQTLHTLTFIVAYSYRPSTTCHKHTSIERTCTGVRPKKNHLSFHGFEACEVRETHARKQFNVNVNCMFIVVMHLATPS